ncbi:17870_t:CDS:2, partial [Funneliformis geosporum]
MKHSRRYQEIKEKIPNNKYYNVLEAIEFLRNNNPEKLKNIKVCFALNQSKRKTITALRSKIILPHPISPKGKIAVVKDDLPVEMTNDLTKIKAVELLSVEELVVHPQNEKKFRVPEKLPPKLFGLIARKVSLTENVLEAVNNFQQGEQEIKTDRGGNIHAVIGSSAFNQQQLEENYKSLYKKITGLKPVGWKKDFLKNITLSTTMAIKFKITEIINQDLNSGPIVIKIEEINFPTGKGSEKTKITKLNFGGDKITEIKDIFATSKSYQMEFKETEVKDNRTPKHTLNMCFEAGGSKPALPNKLNIEASEELRIFYNNHDGSIKLTKETGTPTDPGTPKKQPDDPGTPKKQPDDPGTPKKQPDDP